MIITYDTEFLDDGDRTHLISIGLVAEDGRELYLVNGEAPWHLIGQQKWLIDNVVLPHLPPRALGYEWKPGMTWFPALSHKDVRTSKRAIAIEVEHFLLDAESRDGGRKPELWADYPATDHVVGYQLFGSMIVASRDHGWPMRTSCLTQHEETLLRLTQLDVLAGLREEPDTGTYEESLRYLAFGPEGRPVQDPATAHHALHDARYDMELARWMGVPRLARTGSHPIGGDDEPATDADLDAQAWVDEIHAPDDHSELY